MRPLAMFLALAAMTLPHLALAQEVPVGVESDGYADTDPSAVTEFQQPLAGHGEWIDDPQYGTIWVPYASEVGGEFAPYETGGHWTYDEADGNVWVSDYSWGWATFHYGRWVWVESRGWGWIAGRAYSGAWVNWYMGPEGYAYVGWSPISPSWVWRGGNAVWIGAVEPRGAYYCGRDDLYGAGLAGRVLGNDSAVVIAQPMHPYVPAQPTVGGRANPPRGPSPAMLAIAPARVARPSANDYGVAYARAYARPSTAVSLGARAPVPHVVHVANQYAMPVMRSAPAMQASYAPSYAPQRNAGAVGVRRGRR